MQNRCQKKACKMMQNDAKMEPKWEPKSIKNTKKAGKKACQKWCQNLMPKMISKRRFWMPFWFPGVTPGGKEGKPPKAALRWCWLLLFETPDTGRCRRIFGPLENRKSVQKRIFEDRLALGPSKNGLWKGVRKKHEILMKNRCENERFLMARNHVWRYTLRLFHTFAIFKKSKNRCQKGGQKSL